MSNVITWVAIDDSKKELVVGRAQDGQQKDLRIEVVANENRALGRWVRRLVREVGGGEVRICYEAGPNGFALKRRLEAAGPVVVEVVAPSLTPRRPGQAKVKTDRRDVGKLLGLYRAGELTPVGVPDEEAEAARDLSRLHHRVVIEKNRKRHHILKFLLQRGRIYREGSNWTARHQSWLRSQQWESWKDQVAYEELLTGLGELEGRLERLDHALDQASQEEVRVMAIGVLRCFSGIDTTAAMGLVTELFGVERFPGPRQLMSYVGLIPGVQQSGERSRSGGITKAGNRHVRWVLGQVAWHYRHRPNPRNHRLKKRRAGQPAWAIAIADRAHERLYRRYQRLLQRGKPHNTVITAVARELVAFIWEALIEARLRQGHSSSLRAA